MYGIMVSNDTLIEEPDITSKEMETMNSKTTVAALALTAGLVVSACGGEDAPADPQEALRTQEPAAAETEAEPVADESTADDEGVTQEDADLDPESLSQDEIGGEVENPRAGSWLATDPAEVPYPEEILELWDDETIRDGIDRALEFRMYSTTLGDAWMPREVVAFDYSSMEDYFSVDGWTKFVADLDNDPVSAWVTIPSDVTGAGEFGYDDALLSTHGQEWVEVEARLQDHLPYATAHVDEDYYGDINPRLWVVASYEVEVHGSFDDGSEGSVTYSFPESTIHLVHHAGEWAVDRVTGSYDSVSSNG